MPTRDFRPEVLHAFGTPIIAFDIPEHENINADLGKIILERRQTNKGLVRSNVNSWHSDEDFVKWGGGSAQFLAQTFASICSGVTELPPETGSFS